MPLRRPVDITAVGEVLMDFVALNAASLSTAEEFFPAPGGAPANVAVAASLLGAQCAFVGAVGADPFGDRLRQVLHENGVDVSELRTVDERTTLAFVAKNRGGIPDFVFYRGSDAALQAQHIPETLLQRSRFLYVSSMATMSAGSQAATLRAIQLAHDADVLVCCDPNLRPSSWPAITQARAAIQPLIDGSSIVKVNDDEARLLAGIDDLQSAMERLVRTDQLLVVTMGASGVGWQWRSEAGHVPAPSVPIGDTTGAGDAFVGALLADLSRHGVTGAHFNQVPAQTIVECLRFACAAAALACMKAGAMASLPSRNDVDMLLHAQS